MKSDLVTQRSRWKKHAEAMNIEVLFPKSLDIGSVSFEPIALVKNYGAKKGMIVLQDFEDIEQVREEVVIQGYGYSVVEIGEEGDLTDMLDDWGKSS